MARAALARCAGRFIFTGDGVGGNRKFKVSVETIPVKEPHWLSLPQLRRELQKSIRAVLRKQDGRLHLFPYHSGIGKTQITLEEISQRKERSVYLAPRHDLLQEQLDKLHKYLKSRSLPADIAAKLPDLSEENCDHENFPIVEKAHALGFMYEVCNRCIYYKRKTCRYHRERDNAKDAHILFAPLDYIKVPKFWEETGAGFNRPIVVLDESILDKIQEAVDIPVKRLEQMLSTLKQAHRDRRIKSERYIWTLHHLLQLPSGELPIPFKTVFGIKPPVISMDWDRAGPPRWNDDARDNLYSLSWHPTSRHSALAALRQLSTCYHCCPVIDF
ncbi:MAG: hypothetical protein V1809_10390 [Planctomycetota bacterium]